MSTTEYETARLAAIRSAFETTKRTAMALSPEDREAALRIKVQLGIMLTDLHVLPAMPVKAVRRTGQGRRAAHLRA